MPGLFALFIPEKPGEVAVKVFEISVHVQHIVRIGRACILEFGKFLPGQVGNNFFILPVIDHGGNHVTAVTGGAGDLQEIKVFMVAQNFDVAHLILLAAVRAFHGGHQFFYDAFFHNPCTTAIIF